MLRSTRLNQLLRFCLLIVTLACFSVSAAELKIGYVQVDKLLQRAPQTLATGKKLEEEFSPRSTELAKLENKIRSLETKLDAKKSTSSSTSRRKKEREINYLKLEFQRKQRELREDINLRKNEELAILQDRINKAVRAVADAEKYDLVVYGGVAYASKKIDLTDKVLKLLGTK